MKKKEAREILFASSFILLTTAADTPYNIQTYPHSFRFIDKLVQAFIFLMMGNMEP